MGLFSFLKNAGAKIFNKADKKVEPTEDPAIAAERLRQQKIALLRLEVNDLAVDVRDLLIDLQGEQVTVKGEVDTQADKEKIILALGNVEGVASVDDQLEVANPEPEADFYEVVSGDSLSKIAKKYYGNAMKYPVIFEANQPMLKHPDKIYPGQVLRIPKL